MPTRKPHRSAALRKLDAGRPSVASYAAASELSPATRMALRMHLRLATCRNLMMREARRSIERWGLTLPQFDVLAELSRASETGFTFVELSRLLLVTSGNLTGIVDRLAHDGLVRREVDERDRRLVRIVLMPKGQNLIARIMPAHAHDIQAVLSVLPHSRLAEITTVLGELRDALRGVRAADDGTLGTRSDGTAAPMASARRTRPRQARSSRPLWP